MKGNPRKKQCGSLDLNERPLKKPRMRKHIPQIFDESKPKKTPKPKIKSSIPKSSNSKASAKIKKKLEKDCDKVSDDLSEDVDMQTPNSKIPETIPDSLVLQVSTPEPQILEHAIPAISPPDLEHDIRTDLGHVSKSCKRSLPFNLEDENDVFSIRAAEVIRNHVTHCYNKFLTNPLDSVNEQAVDTNSSIGLEDNLEEAESTSQPNQGNDPSIYQDDQRACQHHFLKVYERRKTKIDLMPLAGNEAHIYQNNHGTIGPTSCRDHILKVYKRRTIVNTGVVSLAGNDTISQNDHKARDKGGSQPDFLENYRTQNIIGTADYAEKCWNALDTNTKCKVTSSAKRTGRRKVKKRATKKRVKIASRHKRSCITISKRITRRNFEIVDGATSTCFSTINSRQKGKFRSQFVGKVLPNENQTAAAMADPESFECVFSLSPMVKSRRKRSIHPKRTKSVCREAVRHADVEHIFELIKSRGQGNVLAAKIKNFLNRLVEHHGSIDLEWLRDVPTNDVKEFLLSIVGLGPKSVDCIRLLSLRHHSFPVDINVARVAVRLGWVPLQPLPDGIQMHLLEAFPLQSNIQKYLWPRLCKLDMLTLYELHYHMITFGKVFCTKRSPNCDACPMRAECRHFASAFASTRLRLPGPQHKGEAASKQPDRVDDVPNMSVPSPSLSYSSESFLESSFQTQVCEPIIEMPESPEHRPLESLEQDIEDFPYEVENEQEIPIIKLNTKAFGENILNFIDKSDKEFKESVLSFVDEISKLHRDEEVSKALVLLNPKSALHPARKLKTEGRLRTEHSVYELPDDHPLLSGFEKREPDDNCPYLLAISLTEQDMYKQKKKGKVSSSKELELYDSEICSDITSYFPNDQIVYGTILIPCRTANRGSFPLNGTYFQVNEVFADHESSVNPIAVARASIWHLSQKTLYCGTTVSSIFKGLSTKDIQYCFWKGFMAMRGYDRKQRAPRPLHKRFHSNK